MPHRAPREAFLGRRFAIVPSMVESSTSQLKVKFQQSHHHPDIDIYEAPHRPIGGQVGNLMAWASSTATTRFSSA